MSEVVRIFEEVISRFKEIDHLVNNAGVLLTKGIVDCTVAEWDRVMDVNVKSVFLTVKSLLKWVSTPSHATVVNVGSVSSFVAQQGTPAYVASKGAVLMLSKAMAVDLAVYGIRVNCVCPGITDTPMLRIHANATGDQDLAIQERCRRVPLERMLLPREIADAVLYLSGDQSSGITGASSVVDAGYTSAAEWVSAGVIDQFAWFPTRSWSLFTLAWWTRFRQFLCAVSRCEAVVLGDVLARRRYLQLARCSLGRRIVSDQQSHADTE